MTVQDRLFAQTYRDMKVVPKFTAKELQSIWNRNHQDQQLHSCMCSATERRNFLVKFYTWYNENYPTPYDSGTIIL